MPPTLGLSGRVIDLQVKWLRVGALDHSDVVSCPFVGFGQSVGPPVGPVDFASVHGDRKGVGQILVTSQHFNQPRTVVHSRVDGIRPGLELRQRCLLYTRVATCTSVSTLFMLLDESVLCM